MICPIMSRPVLFAESQFTIAHIEMEWVECQKENCVWWYPGGEHDEPQCRGTPR